jgi:hypothetical protein
MAASISCSSVLADLAQSGCQLQTPGREIRIVPPSENTTGDLRLLHSLPRVSLYSLIGDSVELAQKVA